MDLHPTTWAVTLNVRERNTTIEGQIVGLDDKAKLDSMLLKRNHL